ncbi:winged helix-turn-helix domain-containing protein [Streptomyces sp. NPDC001351]|uniref:winged helix-turn-helix domain-containing protein n=1 Tax=Streptomyces sp. NPDC001351 TaxID=3364564 RepID=UPI0036753EE6
MGNLPTPLTSFVGRHREVAEIRRLVGVGRLVTLTGAGGVGKTRLALAAAAASRKAFPDGVWIVDLTAVCDPSAVAVATAGALRVPDRGGGPALEQLADHLARHRALIVLDNCEHLIDASAGLAKALLSACPELRVLATSRQTLGVTGEHVFVVPALSIPDEAVELLQERAAAIRPDFRVTDANRAEAARLCADLDGLPLAIELAATRLRSLTVDQVVERLEDRFALLTGGCRTVLPRQRTLRGLIEWSYELCTPAEQLLWNRLSAFRGGFSLDAAEYVCAGDGIAAHEVLDLLDRLVSQSVVLPCEREGLPRYRLLETIRAYGRARLAETGEEPGLLRRHRDFFLALAERTASEWFGPGQERALTRMRAERGNFRAALELGTRFHPAMAAPAPAEPQKAQPHPLERGGADSADAQEALRLAAALRFHWCCDGFLGEGRRQFDRLLAAAPEPTPVRVGALWVAAWVAILQGDFATAGRWLDEAEELGERLDDPSVRTCIQGYRGASAALQGRTAEAVRLFEGALAAHEAAGEAPQGLRWLFQMAVTQFHLGDARAAEETGKRAVRLAEASGERLYGSYAKWALGYVLWARGDEEEGTALTRSALEILRGFNDYAGTSMALEVFAWITASRGDHERAAQLLGAVHALTRDVGAAFYTPSGHRARCEEAVISALGPAGYEKALAEGARHDSPARAIALALDTDSGAGPEGGRDTAHDTGTESGSGTDADGERGAESDIGTEGDPGTDADGDIDVKETAPSTVRRRHTPAAADTEPPSPAEGPRICDVLLVDGDPTARENARRILEASGHRVRSAADGLMGLTLFRQQTPDVAVLAERLPGLDGMSLAGRIRAESAVPIMLIADRDDPADLVTCLEAGADDCLARPVDGSLLVARVRALLRRSVPRDQPPDTCAVRFGDLVYCPESLEVYKDGEPIHLTTTELKLLREFAASPGTVLTRDILLERVWGCAWSGDTHVVDVQVMRLRSKIGRDRIETVRGFGYKLRA